MLGLKSRSVTLLIFEAGLAIEARPYVKWLVTIVPECIADPIRVISLTATTFDRWGLQCRIAHQLIHIRIENPFQNHAVVLERLRSRELLVAGYQGALKQCISSLSKLNSTSTSYDIYECLHLIRLSH